MTLTIHTTHRGDRLHDLINDFLIVEASTAIAINWIGNPAFQMPPQGNAAYLGATLDLGVILPLAGVIECVVQARLPDQINIVFDDATGPLQDALAGRHPRGQLGPPLTTMPQVGANKLAPMVILFYERYSKWIKGKLGKPVQWPATWQMGRVLRNSLAHNAIEIRDSAAAPVMWRGISYSAADNGKPIINVSMGTVEVLLLLFEMNDELTTLGHP